MSTLTSKRGRPRESSAGKPDSREARVPFDGGLSRLEAEDRATEELDLTIPDFLDRRAANA
jgi:hypothetical protein